MKETIYIKDIISCLEEVAPLHWQEDYDNAGLIVGNSTNECTGALICLDVFASTVKEAIEKNCNLIVSHHPFIFRGIKNLPYDSQITQILTLAIKNDIAIYSAHTNIDSSMMGVNDILGEKLGLENISPLENSRFAKENNYLGSGAIGFLKEKIAVYDYLLNIKKSLGLHTIKYIGDSKKQIQKVGYCGGAGSFLIEKAIEENCDVFMSGDLKYHDFLSCEGQVILVDIGHFESENFIKQRFFDIISKKIRNFANLYISEQTNRVKFL